MVFTNNKGIVFTVLSLVVGSFILIIFFQMIELPPDHSVDVTRTKVRQVNNLLDQTTNLISTQAIISTKQSISNMIDVMYEENGFLSDFDEGFEDCLNSGEFDFNGQKNCGEYSNLKEMIESNLSSFLKESLDLSAVFTLNDVVLDQSDPWYLDVTIELNVLIDEDRYFWNVTQNISEQISVVGFKDPIKAVVASSMSSYRPLRDNVPLISMDYFYKNLSDDWLESPSTLNYLFQEEHYFEYDGSISFLDRLRGNLTSSDLGIVSVVPANEGSGYFDSSLDWEFWHQQLPGVQYGEYEFTDREQITEMLGKDDYNNLNDGSTIHGTIIPTDLAQRANMSDSTYFIY